MATWPAIGQNSYITPAVSGAPTLTAGTKSEMPWWPACGQNSYITPAVSGVRNTHRGE